MNQNKDESFRTNSQLCIAICRCSSSFGLNLAKLHVQTPQVETSRLEYMHIYIYVYICPYPYIHIYIYIFGWPGPLNLAVKRHKIQPSFVWILSTQLSLWLCQISSNNDKNPKQPTLVKQILNMPYDKLFGSFL